MALKFWVTGGSYRDSSFSEFAPGTSEVREGPFSTYEDANKAWQSLAWATVDDALAQFHIEEEEIAGGDQEYWVIGGQFQDGFERPLGELERHGPYSVYAQAESKWSELAWQTVDDASARYRIETLKPARSPKNWPIVCSPAQMIRPFASGSAMLWAMDMIFMAAPASARAQRGQRCARPSS